MSDTSERRLDLDAFAVVLVEQYLARLRMFALRRLGVLADADDAAQETISRVLVALREGRVLDMQALPAYIFETARHVCSHHRRRDERATRAYAGLADLEAARKSVDNPLSALISAERRDAVRAVLTQLTPLDRELLRLTYVEGLSAEAIAVRLQLTPVNVRVRRHRLQKTLAQRLTVTRSRPEGT